MPRATGNQHSARVHPLLAVRNASLRRRSTSGPGVASCAAYGMHNKMKVFHCPARVDADWRAAPMARARS
eukprot:12851976-Alexandrium_andersonii.AAC.1